VQKRRRKTFGNSEEASGQLTASKKPATTEHSAEVDEDEDHSDDNDGNDDPDWVRGQTPGGPSWASTLRAKVSLLMMMMIDD